MSTTHPLLPQYETVFQLEGPFSFPGRMSPLYLIRSEEGLFVNAGDDD